ncbi:RNA-directed DNA polymerase, eukaryota, reverse transcriptase zinc-binding domain protein [Tanacetum coccineum]
MVTPESSRIKRYITGLAPEIRGMVKAVQPETIQTAVTRASILTEEAINCGTLFKENDKRKADDQGSKSSGSWRDNKKSKVGAGFVVAPPRKEYVDYPRCNKCNAHHPVGGDYKLYFYCQRPGHFAKYCREPKYVAPLNAVKGNQNQRVCYECGSPNHINPTCPKLNRAPGQSSNQLAIEGNRNNRGGGNQVRGKAYNANMNANEAVQDPKVVTGTFSINDHFASILSLGVNEVELRDIAGWMGCGFGEFPFAYFGLSIGDNMRVIKSIHEVSGGLNNNRVIGGVGTGCGVWRDIVKVGEELDGLGLKFTLTCRGKLVDARDIMFWLDRWVDGRRLCDRFSRLFHLDGGKEGSVPDKGKWVKDLSRLIEEKILQEDSGAQETLWNKLMPKKVNIFVWRALKGRLPFCKELDKRVIDLDSVLSPSCINVVESCAHILVTCVLAMSVWDKIFSWWKMGNVNAFSTSEFLSSYGNVNVHNNIVRVWQAVLWTSGYFIWK